MRLPVERSKPEPPAGTQSQLWIPRSLTQRSPMRRKLQRRKLHNRPRPTPTDKTEVRSPARINNRMAHRNLLAQPLRRSETATGVAASKPAGAAIAPAKQRRVRTILISLGVVAAACVAVGIVAGLSRTSPSQPK